MTKRVLLAPIDPVHDVGLKMINRGLKEAGHETVLLPPDLPPEEIVEAAIRENVDCVLLSRTLGYDVAEHTARFVDIAEAAGLRQKVKLGIGGMAIRPELGAEMGFDGAFGPGTTVAQAIAFVEGRPFHEITGIGAERTRPDITEGFTYSYRHPEIERLLDKLVDQFMEWVADRSSPAVQRAALRKQILETERNGGNATELRQQYGKLCTGAAAAYYTNGSLPDVVRTISDRELDLLDEYCKSADKNGPSKDIRRGAKKPLVFTQYGTGCLVTDIAHVKLLEAWAADGVVHFDPSWGARTEGFLEGVLSHKGDGTIITAENLAKISQSLQKHTLFQVRAHRGLNTPETVMLAGEVGAHLTKININYGSLAGGTDPERLAVDGYHAMRYAAEYGLPFDVVTNEELAGVPAHKAFAGMLVTAHIGRRLGGRPILQPLFCKGAEALIKGLMDDNHVDFNAAKVMALRSIIDAPIWPGAPVGFMTHTEDRVQSAMTTALHAALGAAVGVEAVSIASTDEAYSGGPIVSGSRVDTLRAVMEALRFFGSAQIAPTPKATEMANNIVDGIVKVLTQAVETGFVPGLYQGVFGDPEDGAYPGRAGKGTVTRREQCVR
ncbi:MAG TPA: cobalamin-dependent protein [Symbiobacteriaceae bacterium]|nr:cobalamin-dependent protein [Symbiobacteriaceae bacterium]